MYYLNYCMNVCMNVSFYIYFYFWARRYFTLAMCDPFAVYILLINKFKPNCSLPVQAHETTNHHAELRKSRRAERLSPPGKYDINICLRNVHIAYFYNCDALCIFDVIFM